MTTLAPAAVAFKRILVPTDFSDASQHALAFAKSIARQYQSHLFLVHVNLPVSPITPPEAIWIDDEAFQQQLKQQLEEVGAALHSEGFEADTLSFIGTIQEKIVSIVQEKAVDLIVMGTHARTGLDRFLLGSETEALLRHVQCPVLVIGPKAEYDPNQVWHPRRLICATTLAPESSWIAAYAYRFAMQNQAKFMLFNVVTPEQVAVDGGDWIRFENAFRESLGDETGPHAPLHTLLSNSGPGPKIIDVAKKHHADLIVMGARTASAVATHTMAGTVPRVFAESPCPVMTLHQE